MKVRVYVTLKNGVHDAPGTVVKNALVKSLSFEAVMNVRMGRYIDLTLPEGTTKEQVHAMCREHIVNMIIEQYRLEYDMESPSP